MAIISVGPVIGKVTDTTARVAIELDKKATVKCVATDSDGNTIEVEHQLVKGQFKAFQLEGLKPLTEYYISFQGANSPVPGNFRTFAPQPDRMNVGAVSCNFTIHKGSIDLWEDLRDRYIYPGKLDLLLHLGDQIYGDSAFQEALTILDGRTIGTLGQQKQILELYRRLYRMTWRHRPTREVLAQVPNLMIWDDHEIRDDWGSKGTDYDSACAEYHIGTLARQVFREYQRQLWDEPTNPPSDGFEDHAHVWGQIGVLFVDQRGGRSFSRDLARPYLGQPQWNRISSHLQPNGLFDGVRALIVVTSVPLIYLGDSTTNSGSMVVDDLQDHWAYGIHRSEQIEMLRLLRRWKEDGSGERELLVVGGDVHMGCQTDIKHNKQTIYKQLITSPITNKPHAWFAYSALKVLLESEENLAASYSFEHHGYTNKRNYGVIIIRVPGAGERPKVRGGLEIP